MNETETAKIETALTAKGIRFALLDKLATRKIQQEWRARYSSGVKAKTGKWTHLGFDWHAFSYEFHPSVEAAKALGQYRAATAVGFYVIREGPDGAGFKCAGKTLPDAESLSGADVHVFPLDFSWTMAFTHEEPEIGPFFARRGAV